MLLVKVAIGIFSLSFLILIHELGHFVAARIFGVQVLTFSIGFGKKLLSWKIKGIEYAVSLIPLGGYCRFKGEQNFIQAYEKKMDHIPEESGSIFSVHPWKRIIIAIAGPLMNLVAAFIFLFSIAWVEEQRYVLPAQIVLASDYSDNNIWPADKAGLETGDTILTLDGESVQFYQDIEKKVLLSPGKPLSLKFLRDGFSQETEIVPLLDKSTGAGKVGIYPYISNILSTDFPLTSEAIIPAGSVIMALDGKQIRLMTDIFPLIETLKTPFPVQYSYKDLNETVLVRDKESFLTNLPVPYKVDTLQTRGFISGVTKAIKNYRDSIMLSFHSLAMLFKGIDLVNSVMGPLRAPLMTGEIAAASFGAGNPQGFQRVFTFLASISIALGIINLLPIPVLDGGQILLSLLDLVRKKPLKPDFIFRYQLIGSMLVFVLMFFSISIDILFFFRR